MSNKYTEAMQQVNKVGGELLDEINARLPASVIANPLIRKTSALIDAASTQIFMLAEQLHKEEHLNPGWQLIPDDIAFHPLMQPFSEAIEQTTTGKGNERHGKGRPFMQHPWYPLAQIHGVGGLTFQAAKKLQEAQGFLDGTHEGWQRWKREMLGVLVYTGAAMIFIEEQMRVSGQIAEGKECSCCQPSNPV